MGTLLSEPEKTSGTKATAFAFSESLACTNSVFASVTATRRRLGRLWESGLQFRHRVATLWMELDYNYTLVLEITVVGYRKVIEAWQSHRPRRVFYCRVPFEPLDQSQLNVTPVALAAFTKEQPIGMDRFLVSTRMLGANGG